MFSSSISSRLFSGWPGLEVTAYDTQNNVLPVVRVDRLAPTILFFWAEGIIDHVNIHEPPEGLHFGVDVLGGKMLRYVTVPSNTPPGTVPGMEIPDSSQPIGQRGKNVIKIDPLAATLKKALQNYKANNNSDGSPRQFSSAEFALQMIEGSQSVIFKNKAGRAKQSPRPSHS